MGVHTSRDTCPCYGSPAFTFSDVERAISGAIMAMGYVGIYGAILRRETTPLDF